MRTAEIRRLFEEIVREAERRPEFGRRLADAIGGLSSQPSPATPPKRTRRNRRTPGVLDPFEVFTRGEPALLDALQGFSVDQLKDIVSEHAMDSSKLALKWRSPDRLIELIVTTVRSRIEKGDAFKRDFVSQDTGASEGQTSRAALTQWAQDFQTQRVARLSAGDGPIPMASNKLVCVHVVPCGAVTDTARIDVGDPKTQRTDLAPIGSTGFNTRFNSDGLLRYMPESDGNSDGFLQLFRNGVIESVDSRRMVGTRHREDGLPSIKFVKDLASFVGGACRMFRELDVRPPVLVLVSFVGIRGASLLVPAEGLGSSAYYAHKFDQDRLLLRSVHLGDLNADVRPALRVALDELWQAAGQERCSCYDADGTWRGVPRDRRVP